ncbi:MAG: 30S ribosomal protein S6, partial [Bacteroidetes bacterium]|nr:30S ribosomal protein S6 [Bacteroidota bacterium]
MKRFYECTFIVNPGLDDQQIESTVKMAEDTITKNGGEIVKTEHLGRRRLAYPITKKHNGYYVCIEFESELRIVDKVERFLTLDENVMRYLTIALDERELKAKRDRAAVALQESEQQSGPQRNARNAPVTKPAEKPKPATGEKEADAEKKEADAEKKEADVKEADAPAAETAEAETPAAETPAAETPAAEAETAETPAAETPAAETPAAETAEAETAEAETGDTDTHEPVDS